MKLGQSNVVEVAGCIVRDTPGLSPEGQDLRALNNSSAARSTLSRTDVLLVTLNPQLATGERPELIKIMSEGWAPSSVWFLVSRADEGTFDPASDPAGYLTWADRKRAELRESLSLNDSAPIFVIVPDYAGLAAYEPNPSRSTWDATRDWDGMEGLRAALSTLSASEIPQARSVAERRFWRSAARQSLALARAKRDDLKTSREVAGASLQRRDLFLKQIDVLVDAARASLDGAIQNAVHRSLNSPQLDAESLHDAVDPVLRGWWDSQQAELMRIRQDAIQAFDRERSGRGWAKLESLYSTFAHPNAAVGDAAPSFTPQFEELGRAAAIALKALDEVRRAHRATKQPASASEILASGFGLGDAGDMVTAVLPFVVTLAGLIEDKVQSEQAKEVKRALRQQAEAEIARIVNAAAEQLSNDLEPDVRALHDEIAEQTIGPDEVRDLHEALGLIEDLVRRGESLLEAD